MLTKKQIDLLSPFQKNIFKEYGFREIARLANEKSNNGLQIAIKQFIAEKIVEERKVGTSKLYKISTENELIYCYLELIKYKGFSYPVRQSIETLKKEIEKYTLFYSLSVFGSYASGEQTKKSDLDIAVFIPDKSYEKNIKIATNMAQTRALLPVHIQIITYNEFFEMLVNKEANVGKEIANKHRAMHNINIFYKIILRAIENGFRY